MRLLHSLGDLSALRQLSRHLKLHRVNSLFLIQALGCPCLLQCVQLLTQAQNLSVTLLGHVYVLAEGVSEFRRQLEKCRAVFILMMASGVFNGR
jgi:hypothetical protein